MTKRLLSLVLAVILTFSITAILTPEAQASSINAFYDRQKSLNYASKHWNDGKGLCAEFVSDCLKAGGLTESYQTRVCNLYNALLKKNYGTSYKLKITNSSIKESENEGKLKAGDPIFYYCKVCEEFTHVSLCNGFNSDGYAVEYAHNKPKNGKSRAYTHIHSGCGRSSWTFYSISLNDKETVFGAKTNIEPPHITSTIDVRNGIYLRWEDVDGATYYRVYKKTATSNWIFLANTTSTVYTDTTAKNGVEYTYTVRACKGSTFSGYYAGVKALHLDVVKLKSAVNQNNKIVLSWEKNPQAEGYYIYRQVNNGNWIRVANIKKGSTVQYVDSDVVSGNFYRYRIRAVKAGYAGSYDVNGKGTTCLATPKLTSITNVNGGIKVTWCSVKGAEEYRVYRRASGEKSWSYIATVKETSFTDVNVKSATYYRYTVRPVKQNVYGSFDSNGLLLRCVGTPEVTGAQYGEDGVNVTWTAVNGAKGYYVYHKPEGAKSWRRISASTKTSYLDKVPSEGSTYYYTVKAYFGNVMSSCNMDGVECACEIAQPEVAEDASAMPSLVSDSVVINETAQNIQAAAMAITKVIIEE